MAGHDTGADAAIYEATLHVSESFESLDRAVSSGTTSIGDSTIWVTQLHDNLARFQIWAGNIGALHAGSDRRSADYRLRDTPTATLRIIELLEDVAETHAELLDVAAGGGPSHSHDDDFRDLDEEELALVASGASKSEANELCLSVHDSITSLLKVSALLRKATTRDRYAKAAASVGDDLLPSTFDVQHVREKYRKVADVPWLSERLGRAITQRREYLRYARDHHTKIAKGSRSRPDYMLDKRRATMLMPPGATTISERGTLATTIASTVFAERVTLQALSAQEIEDDDDAYSQASTQVSYRDREKDADKLSIIALSSLSHDGAPFECPYCRGVVQFKHEKAFSRKHVYRDLRAYVCTFEDCTAGLFQERDAWFGHELDHHRRLWICQTCVSGRSYLTAADFKAHLRNKHAEIASQETALTAVMSASSRPVTEIPILSACPLCDDWRVNRPSMQSESQIPAVEQGTIVISPAELKRHLAGHLEELALFAYTPGIDDAKGSGSNDDQREQTDRRQDVLDALDQWREGSVSLSPAQSAQESWRETGSGMDEVEIPEGISKRQSWLENERTTAGFSNPESDIGFVCFVRYTQGKALFADHHLQRTTLSDVNIAFATDNQAEEDTVVEWPREEAQLEASPPVTTIDLETDIVADRPYSALQQSTPNAETDVLASELLGDSSNVPSSLVHDTGTTSSGPLAESTSVLDPPEIKIDFAPLSNQMGDPQFALRLGSKPADGLRYTEAENILSPPLRSMFNPTTEHTPHTNAAV
ncbi:hypothetical protein LTR17_022686 [Elasticomyces elasticus]|nr:hypothetical protein LTR17_022686 [Elasticomyces elasticus]